MVFEVSRNQESIYADRYGEYWGIHAMRNVKKNCDELMVGLLPEAERELTAFALAVTQLFGAEQARQSIEDWMKQLELMDWPTGEALPDWRRITIAAALRLAGRVNIHGLEKIVNVSSLRASA